MINREQLLKRLGPIKQALRYDLKTSSPLKLLVVPGSLEDFHRQNKALNSSHYPFYARSNPLKAHKVNGAIYNRGKLDSQDVSYGIFSEKEIRNQLLNWSCLSATTKILAPVEITKDENNDLKQTVENARLKALAFSVLLMDGKFFLKDALKVLFVLQHNIDPRLEYQQIPATVEQLIKSEYNELEPIYKPLLEKLQIEKSKDEKYIRNWDNFKVCMKELPDNIAYQLELQINTRRDMLRTEEVYRNSFPALRQIKREKTPLDYYFHLISNSFNRSVIKKSENMA